MNLKFQGILDKVNKTELLLQELELVILHILGSEKFKWNNFTDIKRKSTIEESLRKVKALIENSLETRDNIRHLNHEFLRLQIAMQNLDAFSNDLELKAKEMKRQLLSDNPLKISFPSDIETAENKEIKQLQPSENKLMASIEIIPNITQSPLDEDKAEENKYKVLNTPSAKAIVESDTILVFDLIGQELDSKVEKLFLKNKVLATSYEFNVF